MLCSYLLRSEKDGGPPKTGVQVVIKDVVARNRTQTRCVSNKMPSHLSDSYVILTSSEHLPEAGDG